MQNTITQTRLNRFFKLIESLYNIDGIDQGEIDDMLFAYMIYNDGCKMLHEDWHGYAVNEDSPIREFFNVLNSTLTTASHAEMLWNKIMVEHDEVKDNKMGLVEDLFKCVNPLNYAIND